MTVLRLYRVGVVEGDTIYWVLFVTRIMLELYFGCRPLGASVDARQLRLRCYVLVGRGVQWNGGSHADGVEVYHFCAQCHLMQVAGNVF